LEGGRRSDCRIDEVFLSKNASRKDASGGSFTCSEGGNVEAEAMKCAVLLGGV
jgi:hypothetical protein